MLAGCTADHEILFLRMTWIPSVVDLPPLYTARLLVIVRLNANAPICRCNRSQAQFPPTHFQTRSKIRFPVSILQRFGFSMRPLNLLHMRVPNLAVLPLPLLSSGAAFVPAKTTILSQPCEYCIKGKTKTESVMTS